MTPEFSETPEPHAEIEQDKMAPDRDVIPISVQVERLLSDDVISRILEVARERASLIETLKEALNERDIEKIIRTAERLCGVQNSG